MTHSELISGLKPMTVIIAFTYFGYAFRSYQRHRRNRPLTDREYFELMDLKPFSELTFQEQARVMEWQDRRLQHEPMGILAAIEDSTPLASRRERDLH